MELIPLFLIIVFHWIFDFVLQEDEIAKGKSDSWKDLLIHTLYYSFMWLTPIAIYLITGKDYGIGHAYGVACQFVIITFIFHTITDYYTSKAHKALFLQERRHEFFASIGFDQVLHYFQLILTFHFLIK